MIYSTVWKTESENNKNYVLILACLDTRISEYNHYYEKLQQGLETGLASLGRNITLDVFENISRDNTDNLSLSYPLQLSGIILGNNLKQHNIAFRVVTGTSFDEFFTSQEFKEIREEKYSHIFFTTTYIYSYTRLVAISNELTKLFPISKIVAGGQLFSYNRDTLKCPNIDVILIGDGEEIAADIVLRLDKYQEIQSAKDNKKVIIETPTKCLDEYQTIDYKLLMDCIPVNEQDKFRDKYFFPMETVRGCYFKCAFCSSSTSRENTRIKSADKLIEEVNAIRAVGVNKISIWDSNFTAPPSRVKEFCNKLIAGNASNKITFQSYARLSDLDQEMLELMIEAGWNMIYIGIESASENILKKMKKGLTKKRLVEKLTMLSNFSDRIEVFPSFLIGFPGENHETLVESYNVIKNNKFPYINIQPLDVRKGSLLYQQPDKFGLRYQMSPDEIISYGWEHATMNSESAINNALEMFCKVALETDTILLENLLGTTKFTLSFPPFNNQRNASILRILQKIIALGLLIKKDEHQAHNEKEKIVLLWHDLELKLQQNN